MFYNRTVMPSYRPPLCKASPSIPCQKGYYHTVLWRATIIVQVVDNETLHEKPDCGEFQQYIICSVYIKHEPVNVFIVSPCTSPNFQWSIIVQQSLHFHNIPKKKQKKIYPSNIHSFSQCIAHKTQKRMLSLVRLAWFSLMVPTPRLCWLYHIRHKVWQKSNTLSILHGIADKSLWGDFDFFPKHSLFLQAFLLWCSNIFPRVTTMTIRHGNTPL